MPTVKLNEKQDDFVSRCVPIVMHEGTAKDEKQAAAICFSMWKEHENKKSIAVKDFNYAALETMDISGAAQILSQLASLCQSEASQQEPADVKQLSDLMRGVIKFILSEIDEMEAAMAQPADAAEETGEYAAQPKPAMLSTNLTYIKSLHIDKADQFFRDVVAVKSIGTDDISGYTALWGNPDLVDVEREFFMKSTDFWTDRISLPRPLTWDHAQEAKTSGDPLVGRIAEVGLDEVGMWYKGQLDRGYKYRAAIDKLIHQRVLGTSSDSAPQYVIREKVKSGATWLKRWPMFAGALTTTPAEPRMIGSVDNWKSIGIDAEVLSFADAAQDAPRGWQSEADRLKRQTDILKLSL